jgi:hypothetical protein
MPSARKTRTTTPIPGDQTEQDHDRREEDHRIGAPADRGAGGERMRHPGYAARHVAEGGATEQPAQDDQRCAHDQDLFEDRAPAAGGPSGWEPDVDQALRGDRGEPEGPCRQRPAGERAAVAVHDGGVRRRQHQHLEDDEDGRPTQQPAERQIWAAVDEQGARHAEGDHRYQGFQPGRRVARRTGSRALGR